MRVPVSGVTGNPQSLLAKHSEAVITGRVEREACPLNLAPTSSTTAALAMGDALAVARLLAEENYKVSVYLFNIHNKLSDDCAANKQRLIDSKRVGHFTEVTLNFDPPELTEDMVVIDGLFGSGLNKPLIGGFAWLVKYINQCPAKVVSIAIPSGLLCEDNT